MTSSWPRERHSSSNQYQQCSVQDAVSDLFGNLKRLIHKGLLDESDSKWVQRDPYTDSFSTELGRDGIKHLPEKTFQSDFDYARHYM